MISSVSLTLVRQQKSPVPLCVFEQKIKMLTTQQSGKGEDNSSIIKSDVTNFVILSLQGLQPLKYVQGREIQCILSPGIKVLYVELCHAVRAALFLRANGNRHFNLVKLNGVR
jgi:hypothetical protein